MAIRSKSDKEAKHNLDQLKVEVMKWMVSEDGQHDMGKGKLRLSSLCFLKDFHVACRGFEMF